MHRFLVSNLFRQPVTMSGLCYKNRIFLKDLKFVEAIY